MTLYSEKIFEKSFSDEISKEAYLKACKWLAQNVYSKSSSEYLTVKVTKVKTTKKQNPTFLVEIFVSIDEKEIKNSVCEKCRLMHSMFYCIDKPRCDECKLTVYKKELERQMRNIKNYFEEEF